MRFLMLILVLHTGAAWAMSGDRARANPANVGDEIPQTLLVDNVPPETRITILRDVTFEAPSTTAKVAVNEFFRCEVRVAALGFNVRVLRAGRGGRVSSLRWSRPNQDHEFEISVDDGKDVIREITCFFNDVEKRFNEKPKLRDFVKWSQAFLRFDFPDNAFRTADI